jgi:dolichyl-phosphate beta-glucosyltransferase
MNDDGNPTTTLVVPCHDEADRLDPKSFLELLEASANIVLQFVDDGSRDGTERILLDLVRQEPARTNVLTLQRNHGKAEAVRHGMLAALERGALVVGYLDADLATPVDEVVRLATAFTERDVDVLLAARVALLGRSIRRSATRHYLGRVFASAASLTLRLQVYDTQCGAKIFRRTAALQAALSEPFLSRWCFDVELLGRLLIGTPDVPPLDPGRLLEEPLQAWCDVPGSKLDTAAKLGALLDLARVYRDLERRRRAAR